MISHFFTAPFYATMIPYTQKQGDHTMGLFFRKTKVKLMAPVTGMVIPLEQVPDQAFAQKMLGDGVAVRPEKGELVAPCDGK
ncbi:PTS glucose transporter subunit IIA, partial [Acidaminococcus fermentans]|uniref:PTS glucose transporter subunit IIA n=1 Tax=Acidaminococcus fermentans TaxID=905 RepID=UPI00307900A7